MEVVTRNGPSLDVLHAVLPGMDDRNAEVSAKVYTRRPSIYSSKGMLHKLRTIYFALEARGFIVLIYSFEAGRGSSRYGGTSYTGAYTGTQGNLVSSR